jgi:hypothetical protein
MWCNCARFKRGRAIRYDIFFLKKKYIHVLILLFKDDGFDYEDEGSVVGDDEDTPIFEEYVVPEENWLDQVVSMLSNTDNYGNKFVFKKGTSFFFTPIINVHLINILTHRTYDFRKRTYLPFYLLLFTHFSSRILDLCGNSQIT